jgi:hypothetical protein
VTVSESDLDSLYQLPPSEFIAARNALAKRAGAQGADIRALPKPTLAVWAVNQLHWRQPDLYRALVQSAENLRATHKAVIGGGRGDLRVAGRAHEAALESALKATLAIAANGGSAPSDAVRQTIASTLRALPAADPPGRLRQGLTPGGFEVLAGLPAGGRVVRPPAPGAAKPAKGETAARKGKAQEPPRTIDKAALAHARKAVAAADRTLAAAEHTARREEFEAARAAREAEQAERRAARAREALRAAESELEEAEEEAAAAKEKRDAARARAASAETAAASAREEKESAERAVRDIETGR